MFRVLSFSWNVNEQMQCFHVCLWHAICLSKAFIKYWINWNRLFHIIFKYILSKIYSHVYWLISLWKIRIAITKLSNKSAITYKYITCGLHQLLPIRFYITICYDNYVQEMRKFKIQRYVNRECIEVNIIALSALCNIWH